MRHGDTEHANIFLFTLLLSLALTGCRPSDETPEDLFRATTVAEAFSKSNTIENLDLYYRRLHGFPTNILVLTNLKQLNLRTCTIGTLPDDIAVLSELIRLDLGQTGLTNLPPAIGKLTHLTHLWLNDNPLPGLPAEVGTLSNLIYLNADRTQLNQLPEEVGKLANLRWLRLNNNHLSAMPADMSGLAKNLKVLYLIGNPIPEQERNRIRDSLPGCEVIFQAGMPMNK